MNRIAEALEKAEKKLTLDLASCAGRCEDLGLIVARKQSAIETANAELSEAVERFQTEKNNYNQLQGQMTLLKQLQSSTA